MRSAEANKWVEASRWLVELDGSDHIEDLWPSFEAWLAQDPQNLEAFRRMENVSLCLDNLRDLHPAEGDVDPDLLSVAAKVVKIAVAQKASSVHARSNGGASEAFERWLAEDVRHRVAHTIATEAWERMERHSRVRPLDGAVDPDPLLSPAYTPRSTQRTRVEDSESAPASGASSKTRLLGLVALSLISVGALCAAGLYTTEQLAWESYATHVGGKETIPLPDGSFVTLNTDTYLRVRLTPEARELKLLRGEALITVARDDKRPFTLVVGKTAIRTASAEFDIRKRDSGEVDLIVTDGRVDAQSVEGPLESALHLVRSPRNQRVIAAGSMASIRPGDVQVLPLSPGESARKTAWLHDVLDLRDETVAEAADDFNRYNLRKIVIDDPKIAQHRVGGRFFTTSPDSFVAALTRMMDIRVTTVGGAEGPGYGTIFLDRID
jgi:transmembrane sensor